MRGGRGAGRCGGADGSPAAPDRRHPLSVGRGLVSAAFRRETSEPFRWAARAGDVPRRVRPMPTQGRACVAKFSVREGDPLAWRAHVSSAEMLPARAPVAVGVGPLPTCPAGRARACLSSFAARDASLRCGTAGGGLRAGALRT